MTELASATLTGRHIVITRPRDQASTFAQKLRQLGATVTTCPAIAIHPATGTELAEALARIGSYDRLIITSANAARAVLALVRPDVAARLPPVAAIGPETAAVLRAAGWTIAIQPASADTRSLVAALGDVAGQRLLLPQSDLAPSDLPVACRDRGAIVDTPIAYHTSMAPDPAALLDLLRTEWIDAVTLASASAARAVAGSVMGTGLIDPVLTAGARPAVFCIGPATAAAARDAGLPVDAIAATHDTSGLVMALTEWFAGAPTHS